MSLAIACEVAKNLGNFVSTIDFRQSFPRNIDIFFPWEVMEHSLHLGKDAMNVHSLLTDMPFYLLFTFLITTCNWA